MEVLNVTGRDIQQLQYFIDHIGEASETFRYFAKRDTSVIHQHLITLLFLEEGKPFAYGHLEPEGDEVWLGICVLPYKKGMRYGIQMMDALIEKAKSLSVTTIALTVDKVNEPAIRLYERFGFRKVKETNSYFKYELQL